MSRLHDLFARYDKNHPDAGSQTIHHVCGPLILWSIIAMIWTIPVPGTWFQPGAFAGASMAALAAWYFRNSRPLGLGAALTFVLAGTVCWAIANAIGMRGLLIVAAIVFVLAWIGQLIGHRAEGRRPDFSTVLVDLLAGPAWTLSKLYRRLGIAY